MSQAFDFTASLVSGNVYRFSLSWECDVTKTALSKEGKSATVTSLRCDKAKPLMIGGNPYWFPNFTLSTTALPTTPKKPLSLKAASAQMVDSGWQGTFADYLAKLRAAGVTIADNSAPSAASAAMTEAQKREEEIARKRRELEELTGGK